MNKTSEFLCLSGWTAGVLALGIALCFPFFSYLPFIWSAGLASVFVLYFAFSKAMWRSTTPVAYPLISVGYSLVFAIVIGAFTGVERVEQYECDWKMNADGVAVDLRAAGGFGWPIVESTELTDQLKKDQPPKVLAKVWITRDFGRVRARGAIQLVNGIPVREP